MIKSNQSQGRSISTTRGSSRDTSRKLDSLTLKSSDIVNEQKCVEMDHKRYDQSDLDRRQSNVVDYL